MGDSKLRSSSLLSRSVLSPTIQIIHFFSFLISGDDESVNVNSGSKRGRKPGRNSTTKSSDHKGDMKARLERSRQSARECRARKKLRYQYLEELGTHRERSVLVLRTELDQYRQWCLEMDEGNARRHPELGGRRPPGTGSAASDEPVERSHTQSHRHGNVRITSLSPYCYCD